MRRLIEVNCYGFWTTWFLDFSHSVADQWQDGCASINVIRAQNPLLQQFKMCDSFMTSLVKSFLDVPSPALKEKVRLHSPPPYLVWVYVAHFVYTFFGDAVKGLSNKVRR